MNSFRNTCFVFVLCGVTIAHVRAHAFLDHAEPAVGSEVKQAPPVVQIWFTEPLEATSSTIKVFDATQKQIDKKDTHSSPSNKALLQVSLPSVSPGTYKVLWRVTSVDGHVTNGDFSFRIAR